MIDLRDTFDVIIVGGGHAGTEAALASARLGAKTLLLTHQIETLGQMSCNPAIGGIGKGHLVKEIDVLGGIMAKAADHAGIHFRILNRSKGPAVRATRAQSDRLLYKQFIRHALENQPNLVLFQQPVDDIIIENERAAGVKTQTGLIFRARAVVLTAGTFLAGKIHIGLKHYEAGRAGDPPAKTLAAALRQLPLRVGRLKTGTPPRIDGRTINYDVMEKQPGDTPVPIFSFTGNSADHPAQVACHITHTSEITHEIIRSGLVESPIYSGVIEGAGPRYCPSIEDKIVRFADKISHQIFVEPEGLTTHEVYPNGISTSLPFHVQLDLVRSIRGFEKAHITRPGYAIEYDFFDPRDLKSSLETKSIAGLFFAGQINGTTGYEEAAAQGLIAGLNAARSARGEDSWTPRRDEAYIGVLIDDLITLGAPEPYRMFTSRAEYRLLLREDNADIRLLAKAFELGLVNEERWALFEKKMTHIDHAKTQLNETFLHPNTQAAEEFSRVTGEIIIKEHRLSDLIKRPKVCYQQLLEIESLSLLHSNDAVHEQLNVQIKYAGYIARQEEEIARLHKYETTAIPINFDYVHISGLSNEIKQKLQMIKPLTLGSASRIPGITPAALSLLLIYLKRKAGVESIERS